MNSKLHIGNLSFETTEAALRDAFTPFGAVTEIFVASNEHTGRERGFAFVTYATEAESKLAIEKMNGVEMEGCTLTVDEAHVKESPRVHTFVPERRGRASQSRNYGRRR